MKKGVSIAIDGPIAAGKGTLATALADKLDGFFMNTGGMYRALALFCLENEVDVNNENDVVKVLPQVLIELKGRQIILNGANVTERIRESEVASGSSIVAVYKSVREELVSMQQKIAERITNAGQIVVAEGRDTGTKVFPNASLKIFLTASLDIRAKRSLERYKQKGINKTLEEVIAETKLRDDRDTNRDIDPLTSDPQNKGYWILDNSNQTEEESINSILDELRLRKLMK